MQSVLHCHAARGHDNKEPVASSPSRGGSKHQCRSNMEPAERFLDNVCLQEAFWLPSSWEVGYFELALRIMGFDFRKSRPDQTNNTDSQFFTRAKPRSDNPTETSSRSRTSIKTSLRRSSPSRRGTATASTDTSGFCPRPPFAPDGRPRQRVSYFDTKMVCTITWTEYKRVWWGEV